MERRVLLSFQESKKVTALPSTSDTPDLLCIKDLAKSLFGGLENTHEEDILIQNFDDVL